MLMNRQKGQSVVELAFVLPLIFMLLLYMIYGGFVFADYLQYNTAVREAAREIAVQSDTDKRTRLVNMVNSSNSANKYYKPLTNLYNPEFNANVEEANNSKDIGYVTVTVRLTCAANLPFLPETLSLQCTMPIEPKQSNTSDNST